MKANMPNTEHLADRPSGLAGALEGLLKAIGPYKETALLLIALVGAFVFVRDYFATKHEVRILQCQAENGIAVVESRMDEEQLSKRLLDLVTRVDAARDGVASTPSGTAGQVVKQLELEIESVKRERDRAIDTRHQAARNLKAGECDKKPSVP